MKVPQLPGDSPPGGIIISFHQKHVVDWVSWPLDIDIGTPPTLLFNLFFFSINLKVNIIEIFNI